MTFFCLGLDHKRATIDIREAVYFRRKEINSFWADRGGKDTATLYTCNRFEVYGVAENEFEARAKVSLFKERFGGLFDNNYAMYGAENVLAHLSSLAAGLESQVRGELQIEKQLVSWSRKEGFPASLARIAGEALIAGREIRAGLSLNRQENNIASILYENLPREDDFKALKIVVAGTGKIAELFAAHKPVWARVHFAAHKNILKARELAAKTGGRALLLGELAGVLIDTDIFISATASPHRVFGKDYFKTMALLREKELYVYDLAVPRDIDPAVKGIDGIVLKNIDEVVLHDKIKSRHAPQPVGA